MTNYKFDVFLSHEDKGIGYAAKKVLRVQLDFKHSPIADAQLVEPTSNQSILQVEVKEDHIDDIICRGLKGFIEELLSKSGKMPTDRTVKYSIDQVIMVQADVADTVTDVSKFFNEISILKSQLTSRTKDLDSAQQEIGLLNSRLEERKYAGIDNPVTGILSYFSTKSISLSRLIESELDSIFAIKVLRKEIENTLPSYVRHMDGSSMSDEEIQSVLDANMVDLENEVRLHEQESDVMQAELTALDRIRKGDIVLPGRLKEMIIADVVSKNYPEQIISAKQAIEGIANKKILRVNFDKYQKMYDGLDERIDLIQASHESMPVLFHSEGESIDIYLPIPVRNITPNFSDDITGYITRTAGNTLAPHHIACSVNKLAHDRFVAYKINVESAEKIDLSLLREVVDGLLSDVPTSLKLAGYDRLAPHRIGI